ncbi:MAG: SemiSWEET transporter [Candidatus Omnitrophota bacterium]|jgi:MtN3 and saliva related transmembrane protein
MLDAITLIGSIGAFCTTISFLPQVIKVNRTKHARDLSLPMYVIFSIGVLFWMWYGILTASLPIIAANGVTFLFCIYILVMKIRYK